MSESLFCTETLSKKRSKPFVWRTACNISREDINSTAATMRHSTSSCKQMMLVNNCSEPDRSWNSNPPLSDQLSCAGCPSQKEKQGNVAPAQFPSLGAAGSRWRGSDIALLCAQSPPWPLFCHQMLTRDALPLTARVGSFGTNEPNHASNSIPVGVITPPRGVGTFLYTDLLVYLNGSVAGDWVMWTKAWINLEYVVSDGSSVQQSCYLCNYRGILPSTTFFWVLFCSFLTQAKLVGVPPRARNEPALVKLSICLFQVVSILRYMLCQIYVSLILTTHHAAYTHTDMWKCTAISWIFTVRRVRKAAVTAV